MMNHFIYLLLLLPQFALANGKLTSLQIDGDLLIFSTSEIKNSTLPSCVNVETGQRWAILTTTPEGQAAIVLLTTAISANLPISIESAGDCTNTGTFERAKNVSIAIAN